MTTPEARIDKRVIVTGGNSGIGKATVTLLRARGAQVVSADLNAADGDPGSVQADVATDAGAAAAVNAAVSLLGGLEAIVNVAGIQRSGAIDKLEESDWDDQLRINVKSCFLMAKHGVPHLRASTGCSIVTTSSLAGLKGFPGMTGYSASKGAVIAFTRTLAVELSADGIRCNCLCPGWVDTPFNDPVISFEGGKGAHARNIAQTVPLGRESSPSEMAKAIAFLVSDDSSYMTGQNLLIDGGLSA